MFVYPRCWVSSQGPWLLLCFLLFLVTKRSKHTRIHERTENAKQWPPLLPQAAPLLIDSHLAFSALLFLQLVNSKVHWPPMFLGLGSWFTSGVGLPWKLIHLRCWFTCRAGYFLSPCTSAVPTVWKVHLLLQIPRSRKFVYLWSWFTFIQSSLTSGVDLPWNSIDLWGSFTLKVGLPLKSVYLDCSFTCGVGFPSKFIYLWSWFTSNVRVPPLLD